MKTEIGTPTYFEIPELPGRQHFRCKRLSATLSGDACGDRWKAANTAAASARCASCKNCRIGAQHAGKVAANHSPFKARKICARCHMMTPRLIHKHLCVSRYNREREQRIGKNAKGNKPIKLTPLHRRTVSYMANGKLKTKTIDRAMNTAELIVAVLRDEEHAVQFAWQAPASIRPHLQLEENHA